MARTGSASEAAPGLEQALLEYRAAPGRYSPTLREPPALFAAVEEVVQLAIGRGGAGGPTQEAARLFVRSALLHPGANHYAVLGLQRGAPAEELKKRYRLMMRLLHPDFMAGATEWADAAVRVNLAYETLSNPVKRKDYDRQLAESTKRAAQRAAPAIAPARADRGRARPDFRGRAIRLAIGSSFGAAMLLMAALFLLNEPPPAQLVQRAPLAPPPAHAAQQAMAQAAHILSDAAATPFQAQREGAAPDGPLVSPPARAEPVPAATEPALPPAAVSLMTPTALAAAVLVPSMPAAATAQPAPSAAPVFVAQAPPTAAAAPAATAPAAAAPASPPAAPPAPAPIPGLTIAEAHPLLARLVQQVETGRSEELVALADRTARGSPEAQAFARTFDELVKGARPRVVNVQFKGEPREGRLLVHGTIKMRLDDSARAPADFLLQAEFALREGSVVLMRLAPGN